MKAIILAFTLKGQDEEKILDAIEKVQNKYFEHILIHGFMPRKEVEKRNFSTIVVDHLENLFPVRLNMYSDGPLRKDMALAGVKLDATVVVIGDVVAGVAEEVDLYKEFELPIVYVALK